MKKVTLLTAIFISFSFVCMSQVPTSGLVGFYPFSGTVLDFSGNANNPSYVGTGVTLTSDRFGNSKSACDFDGNINSFIRIPADNFPANDRTISVWFNIPDVSIRPAILSYGGDGNCGTTYFMAINVEGYDNYTIQGHCHYNELNFPYAAPPINNWYNWVVTVNGSTQKIYVNGEFMASAETFTGSTYVAGKDLALGVLTYVDGTAPYTDANCGYLRGKLDDIRIYNTVLSDAEIISLYEDITTGIIENKNSVTPTLLQSHPDGFFTIDLGTNAGKSDIFVKDMFGRTILTDHGISHQIYNLKLNAAPGIYLMNILSDNKRTCLKLIKY